jgi:biopolymer transport protein ExbD
MKFTPRNKLNPAFNYASFADMALQWLIFFLLSWSFVVTPGIKVQLPKMVTGEVQSDRQSVVTLTSTGRIFLGTEEVTKTTLAQKLIPIIDRDRDHVIVVRADQSVSLQSAVELIDIAKGIGAQRFMIATEAASQAGQ